MITSRPAPATPGDPGGMGFRSVRQRIRRIARSLALRIPPIKKAAEELESYRQTFRFAPAGHFYSPLPSLEEVSRDAGRLFGPPPEVLPGIELNEAAQLALLQRCSQPSRAWSGAVKQIATFGRLRTSAPRINTGSIPCVSHREVASRASGHRHTLQKASDRSRSCRTAPVRCPALCRPLHVHGPAEQALGQSCLRTRLA